MYRDIHVAMDDTFPYPGCLREWDGTRMYRDIYVALYNAFPYPGCLRE